MIRLEGLRKVFYPGTVNERVAIDRVDLRLKPGDFVTIIGSNGAGKSTLLNLVAGTYRPDAGEVWLGDIHLTPLAEHQRARYLGRVFQDPLAGTAAHMTVAENLAMALRRGSPRRLCPGVTRAGRRALRQRLASLGLGLENRLDWRVGLLSGGQRQALTLLMAILTRPQLLLLDEHTAALDPRAARTVLHLTATLVAEEHLTALMVTHNMEEALQVGNRTIMMHEGRIVYDVSGELRRRLGVSDLLRLFGQHVGQPLASDRMILGSAAAINAV